MTLLSTTALQSLLAQAAADDFELGFLYLFSGPVPASAGDALDMVALHTEAVKISNNSTATGLTFEVGDGQLHKTSGEAWSGVVATDGKDGGLTTITPTFYRLCKAGDNGRAAANTLTGSRIQGTVGGPNSGADLQLGNATLTEGNTQPIGVFSVSVGGAG